jgi:hypothetical protein
MRWALLGVGILMILIGTVWMLQGTGVLPGSPMTGDSFWAQVGSGLMIAGLVVCGLGFWLGTKRRPL